jgi:hypothetical protein
VGSRLDEAARAKSFAGACSNHERDWRRHGADRNRWKDVSLLRVREYWDILPQGEVTVLPILDIVGEDKAGSWKFADECGGWRSLFVFRRERVLWAWGLKGRLSRSLASILPSLETEMSLQFRIYVSNVTAHEFNAECMREHLYCKSAFTSQSSSVIVLFATLTCKLVSRISDTRFATTV